MFKQYNYFVDSNEGFQLAHVYGKYFFLGMTLSDVSSGIRYVFSSISTIRTTKPWRLTAFKFLMISQSTLSTEHTCTIGARESFL